MAVYNRDLCRRHVPVVINAIKQLESNQAPERQPYVAAFSLTGEDANKTTVSNDDQGDSLLKIEWEFPQEYASIFQAARTDPNMILSIGLTVTYQSGGAPLNDGWNVLANASINGTGTAPFDASYYPDYTLFKPLQAKVNDGTGWYDAVTSFIDDGNNPGLQFAAGAMPYISTTITGLRVTFRYVDELSMKRGLISENSTKSEIKNWLQTNVKLTRFNVSGVYTPSHLP